jgi:hypothetical protein
MKLMNIFWVCSFLLISALSVRADSQISLVDQKSISILEKGSVEFKLGSSPIIDRGGVYFSSFIVKAAQIKTTDSGLKVSGVFSLPKNDDPKEVKLFSYETIYEKSLENEVSIHTEVTYLENFKDQKILLQKFKTQKSLVSWKFLIPYVIFEGGHVKDISEGASAEIVKYNAPNKSYSLFSESVQTSKDIKEVTLSRKNYDLWVTFAADKKSYVTVEDRRLTRSGDQDFIIVYITPRSFTENFIPRKGDKDSYDFRIRLRKNIIEKKPTS